MSWPSKPLEELGVTVIDGDRGSNYPKAHDFLEEGYCLFLSATNVTKSGFKFDECQFISKEKHNQLRKGHLQRGDIVVTTRGSIGNIAYYDESVPFEVVRLNSGMVIVRNSGEHLETDYLYALLRSPWIKKQFDRMVFGSAQPQLTVGILNQLDLPCPQKTEQRKIAEILSTWDRAINLLSNKIEEKERLKHSLKSKFFRKCVFNRLYNQHYDQSASLGELFRERVETSRPDLKLLAITGADGVVDRDELVKRDTSNPDKSKYLRIAPGDIGYNTMRMWQGVSGLSTLEGIISPAYTVCIPSPSIDPTFFSYLFKFKPMIHLFWRNSQGLVDDTLNLKFPSFARIKVAFPKIDEQKKIGLLFKTLDEEIALLNAILVAINRQKQGLMQKLLTGKVRVKV